MGCGQGEQLALGSGHTGFGHTGSGHTGSGHTVASQTGALQIGALYTNLGQLQTGVGHAGGSQTHLKKKNFSYYFSPSRFFFKINLLRWRTGWLRADDGGGSSSRISRGAIACRTIGATGAIGTAVKNIHRFQFVDQIRREKPSIYFFTFLREGILVARDR